MIAPRAARIGPAVAGRWYPAGAGALADAVDELLDGAADAPAVPAVVAPHAGYAYSGEVAASAFRRFSGSGIARWLLLGPSHYFGFRGARIPDAAAYATPLGDVPIDLDAVRGLAEHPLVAFDNAAFAREHSLESEIPFLQRVLGSPEGFTVIPVLVGSSSSPSDLRSLADALRPFATEGTAIVVSSDFTHYGDAFGYVPFRGDVEPKLRELDLGAAERIVSGDVAGFRDYCDRTGATICGRHAIEAALSIWPARGSVDAYATSGAKTGDWEHTVSYAAIALERARE